MMDPKKDVLPLSQPFPGDLGKASQKPASVNIVAMFAIVFGAAGMLCCGVFRMIGTSGFGATPLADGTTLTLDPDVANAEMLMGAVTMVLSGALVVVGVGALTLQRWARKFGLLIAALLLAMAAVRFVVTLTFTGPRNEALSQRALAAEAKTQKETGNAPRSPAQFMSAGTIGVGIGLFAVEALTPLLILMLWTRAPAISAFATAPGRESGGRGARGTPPI